MKKVVPWHRGSTSQNGCKVNRTCMPKVKYYYDAKSLSYQRVERTWKTQVRNTVLFLLASVLFAALMLLMGDQYIDSPKERQMRREIEFMQDQYSLLNRRLEQMDQVLYFT